MKKSFKLILVVTAGLFLATVEAKAAVITQWNFNGDSSTTVPGGTLSPTASTGTGTSSLVGGTTGSFSSGIANGGSSDPVLTSPANFGWQTTTYPAQSTANKSAGVQFLVSTAGFEDITVSYDLRHSNTSSRYEQLQYTLDGTTWNDLSVFDGNAGDTWFNSRFGDLTAITAADNNPSFGIRVVSVFDPAIVQPGGYSPSEATSSYAGGTWRFDMVTINGIAVPEPTSVGLAAFGVLGLVIGARRKIRSV